MQVTNAGTTSHTVTCSVCGYSQTVSHTWGSYSSYDSSSHIRYCSVCAQSSSASHTFTDDICTACGYEREHTHTWGNWTKSETTHTRTCSGCGQKQAELHNMQVTNAGTTSHTVTCSVCGYSQTVSHTWGSYSSYDSSSHIRYCSVCAQSSSASHTFSGDRCTECGYEHTHTWGRWIDNETTHTRTCSGCGQKQTEPHDWNHGSDDAMFFTCRVCTHIHEHTWKNNGLKDKCTVCGYEITHTHTWLYEPADTTESTHTINCRECEETKTEPHDYKKINEWKMECRVCYYIHEHTWKDDEDKCTECGYETTHTHTWWHEPADTTESTHTINCSECKKTKTEPHDYRKINELKMECRVCYYIHEHTWIDNGLNDKCTKCGLEEDHDYYEPPEYLCNRCGKQHAHTGGTHENGGKCVDLKCGTVYQPHEMTKVSQQCNENGTHSTLYKCSNPDCTKLIKGEPESCWGGTHTNGGMCTYCLGIYQNHRSKLIYIPGESGSTHSKAIGCENCNYSEKLSTAACIGATHENGGKCSLCGNRYQAHEDSGMTVKYKITATEHIPLHRCTLEGCTGTYRGDSEEHKVSEYIDKQNGTHSSKCIVCGYVVVGEHTYDGSIATYDRILAANNAKMYIPSVINNNVSTYALTVANKNEEIKCIYCNALKSSLENGCEHSYIEKNSETQHWEECSKCGQVKRGTLEGHIFTNYVDNGKGEHAATCSKCEYKLTETHYYEDGICKECSAKKANEDDECEHDYIVKSHKTNHWEECSKCGKVKAETLEEHTFTNYVDNKNGTHTATCSKCGYKLTEEHKTDGSCTDCENPGQKPSEDDNNQNDNTNKPDDTTNKPDNPKAEYPYTGVRNIAIIAIFALGALGTISAVKMKKYKGI